MEVPGPGSEPVTQLQPVPQQQQQRRIPNPLRHGGTSQNPLFPAHPGLLVMPILPPVLFPRAIPVHLASSQCGPNKQGRRPLLPQPILHVPSSPGKLPSLGTQDGPRFPPTSEDLGAAVAQWPSHSNGMYHATWGHCPEEASPCLGSGVTNQRPNYKAAGPRPSH